VADAMKWAAVDRRVRSKVIWFRPLASAITIGSGGSGGREGPMVQMGAAIGSFIGKRIHASSERIRLLIGCGSAAAVAAAFNAPLGGLIFAIEVIMGDFNIKVFSPLIFSSVIATATARHIEGDVPVFDIPHYASVSTYEIFFFMLLGLIGGLLAVLFYKIYFKVSALMENAPVHPIFIPAIGGVIVGFIGIIFPDVLGNGYASMDKVLTGNMGLTLAFMLIFIKIIATSFTIGSKGSGGMFAPALFIGTMAGGAFGMVLNMLFPDITGPSGAYALVGMGAVMSAAAHMPLTMILMVFELTNNYYIILPIMVACISSTFIYSYFLPNSIYHEKLRLKGVTLWQGRESRIMDTIKVKDTMTKEFATIPENLPFKKILTLVKSSRELYFHTVDDKERMTGILSVQDIREFIFEAHLGDLVIAKELANSDVITIHPDETLNIAMEKFAIRDLEELPVVGRGKSKKMLGVIKRKDVINAYKKAVLEESI
jgi:CIC family chloride channel protein